MTYFFNLKPTSDVKIIKTYCLGWLHLKGCFETMLVKNAKVQFLTEHLVRAQKTNQDVFSLAYDYESLQKNIEETVAGYCKIDKDYKLKIIFSDSQVFYSIEDYELKIPSAIHLVSKNARDNFSDVITSHKLCDYTAHLNLLTATKSNKVWDCVRTNGELFLETTKANIYFCKEGEVFTPPAGDLLPGILRQLAIARGLVNESNIFIKSLGTYDGMLVSNSLIEFQAVDSLDGVHFLKSRDYLLRLRKQIFS